MSGLNVAAKTRMIAKGLFSSGDERRAHAVNCAANEIDRLTKQNAKLVEMLEGILDVPIVRRSLDDNTLDCIADLLTEIKGKE